MRSKRDLVAAEHTGGDAGRPQITEFPWKVADHLVEGEESLLPRADVGHGKPGNGRMELMNRPLPPPGTGRGRHS